MAANRGQRYVPNRIGRRRLLETAEAFGIREIIDPRATRRLVCDFMAIAQEITRAQLGPKVRAGIRP